ncbi:MAG: LytTR family transcriptional regulator DNA-binding domain-containing protein [Lachnospiraceae bacterium]|nr:LytTR family transcriptional regulator DNA-binding domain-containing protein [Lachnospiraceae bacterium]
MKVEIKQVSSYEEEQAVISAVSVNDDIRSAIEILENSKRVIPVISDQGTAMLRTEKIYYIESVDKRTYAYTKDSCYETRLRLYELEEKLSSDFFRCSKAMIVNIRKIRSVKSEVNARLSTELLNGERIIISRGYVKELKKKLGV